jgi:ribonuclease III
LSGISNAKPDGSINMLTAAHSLERRLGHSFTEASLLSQALTHRSFGTPHNERLEFLGDSILNCAIAQFIFHRFVGMPEGELSRLRANLVNQNVLAEIAAELELGSRLRLGEGELKTGGAQRPSILADAVEALLGAVFLDAGFDAASKVVERLFAARLDEVSLAKPIKDAKTLLQEWLQAKHLPLPTYTVMKIEGEAHKQMFQVQCLVKMDASPAGNTVANGKGVSRRIAEQEAATQVLSLLMSAAQVAATTNRKRSPKTS